MELDNQQIMELHDNQKKFFKTGTTLPISFRISMLQKLQENLVNSQQEILDALQNDMGKPPLESYLSEYHFVLTEIRLTCKKLKKWLKPERVSSPIFVLPARSQIFYRPFGNSLIIAPWNYPIQLAFAPLIAAIAAGNTVVLKPSEATPHCEKIISKIIDMTFPPEYCHVVLGDADVSKSLLNQRWDFIFFTGSNRVGKIVAAAAAENLTPVILELGGKCPCVVDENIDLQKTAERILTGKLFNGGQTCFAPDYVVVHEDIKQRLVDQLKSCFEELPWDEDLTNIIDKKSYDRILNLADSDAIVKGSDNPDNLHLAPRIMPDASWNDPIMQEEIFGPILPIVTFRDHAELISKINSMPSPLTLYYFGRDKKIQQQFIDKVQTGAMCINDTMKQGINLELPFGGVGESGHGRYRGKHGVRAMSFSCSVTRRYFMKDVFSLLPPYGDKLEWMRKFIK